MVFILVGGGFRFVLVVAAALHDLLHLASAAEVFSPLNSGPIDLLLLFLLI